MAFAFLQKNYMSIHGKVFGLIRGLAQPFDAWLHGDSFQGLLEGTASGLVTIAAESSQALAPSVQFALNQFSTVASGSFRNLPPCVAGMTITIANDGSNVLQVCGSAATADTIDGVASATGVALTNARRSVFKGVVTAVPAQGSQANVPGQWVSMGLPKST